MIVFENDYGTRKSIDSRLILCSIIGSFDNERRIQNSRCTFTASPLPETRVHENKKSTHTRKSQTQQWSFEPALALYTPTCVHYPRINDINQK